MELHPEAEILDVGIVNSGKHQGFLSSMYAVLLVRFGMARNVYLTVLNSPMFTTMIQRLLLLVKQLLLIGSILHYPY